MAYLGLGAPWTASSLLCVSGGPSAFRPASRPAHALPVVRVVPRGDRAPSLLPQRARPALPAPPVAAHAPRHCAAVVAARYHLSRRRSHQPRRAGSGSGLASLQNTHQLLHAAPLDLVWARLGQQPWLVVPALGGTVALVLAGHWAERDATRESLVLLLRGFHEQSTRAGKTIAVGLWAARWVKTKLHSTALRVALGTGALLLGVALALVSSWLN